MELCLITSNIRFDNPADGANAWPARREFLAEILLRHKPDLISTQEGRYHQLMDLQELLEDFEIIDQHRSWIKERMYPSLYVRKESFEYVNSGDLWLSETPDVAGSISFGSAFPRLMTWALLQIKNTEQKLLVVNTHLDHVKSETRIQQIQVLSKEIKRIWEKNAWLIIMGDFNDSPTGEVRDLLEREFPELQDAWGKFNDSEETSHHAFTGEMQNGARIDWILTDARANLQDCLMDKSVKENRYPSDHFPIVCKLKL